MYNRQESQSDSVENLTKALLEVHKQNGIVIDKDKEAFGKRKYASLPAILNKIKDMISSHGLILTQGSEAEYGGSAIFTLLEHPESGEYRKTLSKLSPKELPILPDYIINKMDQNQWNSYCKALIDYNPDQAWGSSTTYHRRYDAMMICGFTSADDPTDFNEGHKEILSDNSVITVDQAAHLLMLANGNTSRFTKIFEFNKITDISQLPASQYDRVIGFLTKPKPQG